MTDFLAITVTLILASNPLMLAASLHGRPDNAVLAKALVFALLLLVMLAGTGAPLLDALDIEPETFRVAAGAILLVSGAAAAFPFGGPRAIEAATKGQILPAVFPIAWPGIATAAACAGAVNFGANDGGLVTSIACLVVVAVAGGVVSRLAGRARLAVLSGARFVGGVLIVAGVDLVISGVQSV